jgi:hypothetical protein
MRSMRYPVRQVTRHAGTVDALPLGTAKLAVLKDKRVLREGAFTGAQQVKG